MSDKLALALPIPQGNVVPRVERRSRFFTGMSILLFAFVLSGFARSFFFRASFDVPPIPWYVYVHGLLLTAWFLLLLVQTTLVARGRTDLHRRLGIGGAVLAVAVIVASLATSLLFPARAKLNDLSVVATSHGHFDPEITTNVVVGNLGGLVICAGLIAAALYLRRHSAAHKRLMLLASLALVGPAVARTVTLAADTIPWAAALQAPIQISILLALPLLIVLYDIVALRRLHPATLWGVSCFFAVMFAAFAFAGSAAGHALVVALE